MKEMFNPTKEQTIIANTRYSIGNNLDFASEFEGSFEEKFKVLTMSMRNVEKYLDMYFTPMGLIIENENIK